MIFSKYKKSRTQNKTYNSSHTRRIDEIGSGIPFEEIYSTVLPKSFILPGMAEINIAEIDTLEKKSKKDLILFLFGEFFIILL